MSILHEKIWDDRKLSIKGETLVTLYTVEGKRGHYCIVSDLPGIGGLDYIKGLSVAKHMAEQDLEAWFRKFVK